MAAIMDEDLCGYRTISMYYIQKYSIHRHFIVACVQHILVTMSHAILSDMASITTARIAATSVGQLVYTNHTNHTHPHATYMQRHAARNRIGFNYFNSLIFALSGLHLTQMRVQFHIIFVFFKFSVFVHIHLVACWALYFFLFAFIGLEFEWILGHCVT